MANRFLIGIAAAAMLATPAAVQARDMFDSFAEALGLTGAAAEGAEAAPGLELAAAPVAPGELDDLRGGFALPGGITIAFGFDLETRLGGALVQRLSLPMGTIGAGASRLEIHENGTVRSVGAAEGPLVLNRSFNNGATQISTTLDRGVVGLVQNSQDGQAVQQRSSFQVDIGGMRQMLSSGASRRHLDSALTGASGRRR